jgi:AbrB family looped-hinge helix DNA binding protein
LSEKEVNDMERPARVRIAAKGRVVIPASFRDALGWKEGDEVQLRIEENEIRISTLRSRIKDAQSFVRGLVKPSRTLSTELIEERREAAKRE